MPPERHRALVDRPRRVVVVRERALPRRDGVGRDPRVDRLLEVLAGSRDKQLREAAQQILDEEE